MEIKSIRSSSQLQDIPDLYHHIMLLLPVKDAARTCILSKSWLHAWSTIPTLRLAGPTNFASKEQHLEVVKATLLRYIRDNIPIENMFLSIEIRNQELASFAEKQIRSVATKGCLRQIFLGIIITVGLFTLPDEIFSCKNLNKMTLSGSSRGQEPTKPFRLSGNTAIQCVSLKELELREVQICDEVIQNLLSTCSLLEKITLLNCWGCNTIKVKNLRFLYKLIFHGRGIEVDHVPNLRFFCYSYSLGCPFMRPSIRLPFNTDSLGSVTELRLYGLILDDAFFDLMKSNFPFLERLTLGMESWRLESFDITSVSLKRLFLWYGDLMLTNIQVYAPKLGFFRYEGKTMPSLLFPAITPEHIKVDVHLRDPGNDHSFFHRMRKTLMLSSKFNIKLRLVRKFDCFAPLNNDDVDFIGGNVQRLSLEIPRWTEDGWVRSLFFDSLIFLICHPKLVVVEGPKIYNDNTSFRKLMLRDLLTRKGYWGDELKDVEIKNPVNKKWEILTDSSLEFNHDKWHYIEFKLNWSSSLKAASASDAYSLI